MMAPYIIVSTVEDEYTVAYKRSSLPIGSHSLRMGVRGGVSAVVCVCVNEAPEARKKRLHRCGLFSSVTSFFL